MNKEPKEKEQKKDTRKAIILSVIAVIIIFIILLALFLRKGNVKNGLLIAEKESVTKDVKVDEDVKQDIIIKGELSGLIRTIDNLDFDFLAYEKSLKGQKVASFNQPIKYETKSKTNMFKNISRKSSNKKSQLKVLDSSNFFKKGNDVVLVSDTLGERGRLSNGDSGLYNALETLQDKFKNMYNPNYVSSKGGFFTMPYFEGNELDDIKRELANIKLSNGENNKLKSEFNTLKSDYEKLLERLKKILDNHHSTNDSKIKDLLALCESLKGENDALNKKLGDYLNMKNGLDKYVYMLAGNVAKNLKSKNDKDREEFEKKLLELLEANLKSEKKIKELNEKIKECEEAECEECIDVIGSVIDDEEIQLEPGWILRDGVLYNIEIVDDDGENGIKIKKIYFMKDAIYRHVMRDDYVFKVPDKFLELPVTDLGGLLFKKFTYYRDYPEQVGGQFYLSKCQDTLESYRNTINEENMDWTKYFDKPKNRIFKHIKDLRDNISIKSGKNGYVNYNNYIKFENLILPKTIKRVHDFAFYDARINAINFTENLKKIGIGAFAGCVNIEKNVDGYPIATRFRFEHDPHIEEFSDFSFANTHISGFGDTKFPKLKRIGKRAFSNVKVWFYTYLPNLFRLTYNTLEEIDDDAISCFKKSKDDDTFDKFMELQLNNMEKYSEGDRQLRYNTLIRKLILPMSLKKIGDFAFSAMPFKSISIPSSIESIGRYPFGGTKNYMYGEKSYTYTDKKSNIQKVLPMFDLADVFYVANGVPINSDTYKKLGRGSFSNSMVSVVKIPFDCEEIGEFWFSNCKNLRVVMFGDHMIDPKDGKCHIMYFNTISGKSSNLKTLKTYAFFDCENLKVFYIPSSLNKVELNALGGHTLKNKVKRSFSVNYEYDIALMRRDKVYDPIFDSIDEKNVFMEKYTITKELELVKTLLPDTIQNVEYIPFLEFYFDPTKCKFSDFLASNDTIRDGEYGKISESTTTEVDNYYRGYTNLYSYDGKLRGRKELLEELGNKFLFELLNAFSGLINKEGRYIKIRMNSYDQYPNGEGYTY